MQRQLVQRFPLLGMLYSLLAFAWLQASYAARDLAEAQPSSLHGCTTTINSAWQLNRELVNLQTKSLRVCLDPADDSPLTFQDLAPLSIKEGTDIYLNCAGRKLNTFTDKGDIIVGSKANFTLEHCNMDGLAAAGKAPAQKEYIVLPGVQVAQDAHLQIMHSFARRLCAPEGLELNRDQVHTLSAFKMGPMATEDGTAISARTIVFAQYGAVAMPETSVDASSMRPAADVQNTTLWCGDTWELARPTAIKALELASDALAEAAGTPVDGGGGSSNNDARSFMIGTFVLACLVAALAAGAAVFFIRRKRATERQVDVSNVYASAHSSPVGHDRTTWFKAKLPGALQSARVRSHERSTLPIEAAPEFADPRGSPHQIFRSSGGSCTSDSGRVKSAIHKVISLGRTSSHRNGSGEGQSKMGGSSNGVLDSPGLVPAAKSHKTSGGGASGSSLMPPTSTQNVLFVCNETDEPTEVVGEGSRTPVKKLFSTTDHPVHALPSAAPSMVPASHKTHTAGASGSRDGVSESCRAASGSMTHSSGVQIRRGVGSLRSEVANAVTQLQDALRSDLQEDQLEVYDVLGRGGFGTVYYGQWRGLSVAIKTLVFQSDSEDNQLAKVASEVAIASNLVHHNIVATYSHDVCPVQDNSNNELGIYKFYLIQEYCNGGSLRSALGKGLFGAEHLPQRWDALMTVLREVAAGMNYMHEKRICHGDLNPSNILLKFEEVSHSSLAGALKNTSAVCKIADFGMARRMQGNRSYASNVRQGTPFYISPETINQHRLHRSSDVYAFGVIMWEMMRGVPVFVTRPNTKTSRNEISTEAVEDSFQQHPDFPYLPASVPLTYTLTMKACLSERPDDRPSFGHLKVLLQDLLHEVAQGSYINSLGTPQDSSAVQQVPDGKVLSTSMAAPESSAAHKSMGVNGMTTLSHALNQFDLERDEPVTNNPVSGSMPLSHSILLTGFKSTVMSIGAPALVPESEDGSNVIPPLGASHTLGPSPSRGPRTPPVPSAKNADTMQRMLFGTLGKKSRKATAAKSERSRVANVSPRDAAAHASFSALNKIQSLHKRLQTSASGMLRTVGNSNQLSTADRRASDSDSTAELLTIHPNDPRVRASSYRQPAGRAIDEGAVSPSPSAPVVAHGCKASTGSKGGKNSVQKKARDISAEIRAATFAATTSPRKPPPAAPRPPLRFNTYSVSPSAPLASTQQSQHDAHQRSAMATVPPVGPQTDPLHQGQASDTPQLNMPSPSRAAPLLYIPNSDTDANICGHELSPRTFDDTASAVLATPQPSTREDPRISSPEVLVTCTPSERFPSERFPSERFPSERFSEHDSWAGNQEPSVMLQTESVTFDMRQELPYRDGGLIGGDLSITQSSVMQFESTLSATAAPPSAPARGEGDAMWSSVAGRARSAQDQQGSMLAGAETTSTQFTGWSAMHEASSMHDAPSPMREGPTDKGGARSNTFSPSGFASGFASDPSALNPLESFASALDASPLPQTEPHAINWCEENLLHAAPAVMVTRKRWGSDTVNERQNLLYGATEDTTGQLHDEYATLSMPLEQAQAHVPPIVATPIVVPPILVPPIVVPKQDVLGPPEREPRAPTTDPGKGVVESPTRRQKKKRPSCKNATRSQQ